MLQGQTTPAAEHFWEQEVAVPAPAGSGAARTGSGHSPARTTEGAGLQTASKAEQERESLYLNRLTAASLLHVDYKVNLLHVVKKEELSGPSSNVCPSPSATHGGAARGPQSQRRRSSQGHPQRTEAPRHAMFQ